MQRSRSREGAWIEISISASAKLHLYGGRSREGAWIEIGTNSPFLNKK